MCIIATLPIHPNQSKLSHKLMTDHYIGYNMATWNPGVTNSSFYPGVHKIRLKAHLMVVKKNNCPDRFENTLATVTKANAGLGLSPTLLTVYYYIIRMKDSIRGGFRLSSLSFYRALSVLVLRHRSVHCCGIKLFSLSFT